MYYKPLKAEDALSIREFLLKLRIFSTNNGRKHAQQKLNNFENTYRGESGNAGAHLSLNAVRQYKWKSDHWLVH